MCYRDVTLASIWLGVNYAKPTLLNCRLEQCIQSHHQPCCFSPCPACLSTVPFILNHLCWWLAAAPPPLPTQLQPPTNLKRLRTSSCRITGKLRTASPENDISTFIPTPTWGSPRVSDDQAAVAAAKLKGGNAVSSSGRPRRVSSLAVRAATAAALFDEAAAAEGCSAAAAAAVNVSGVGSGCADVPLTWQQQQQHLEKQKTFSGDGRGGAPSAAAVAGLRSGSGDISAGTSAGDAELQAAECDPWVSQAALQRDCCCC
jgi:hypothetical protein